MSIPEPAPRALGKVVPDALLVFISKSKRLDDEQKAMLTTLVQERDAFGRAKYNQPLMTDDGRNGVEDARQEVGDLLMYSMKCLLNADPDIFILDQTVAAAVLLMLDMFK